MMKHMIQKRLENLNRENTSFKIREFNPLDLNAILSIEKDSFNKDTFDKETFIEFYRTEPYGFLVAEHDDKIIGYIITSVRRDYNIISIAVSPEYRKNGVGSSILKKGLEILESEDIRNARLLVRKSNKVAHKFYEKNDFKKVGTLPCYYGDEDAVIMINAPR